MFSLGAPVLFRILLRASILSTVFASRCFCGYGGICQFEPPDVPVPENCSRCEEVSGSLYESDCRTLARHCDSTLCKNGGTCVPVLGATFCICPSEYFDVDCSKFNSENSTERLQTPVIYYSLHGSLSERRYVYIGVKHFGDNFKAILTFNKFGTHYHLSEFDFEWVNFKSICLQRLKSHESLEDPAICEQLPDEEILAAAIPHAVHAASNISREITMMFSNGRRLAAYVDHLEIRLQNGQHTAFNHTYKLITTVSELELTCLHLITLSGCSDSRDNPLIVKGQSGLVIESIILKKFEACRPVKVWSQKWFRMTLRKLNEIEEAANSRVLKIGGSQLEEGIHEVQFLHTILAHPPHYGTNNTITSAGICWFRVYNGPLNVAFDGGDLQTIPCNVPFTLKAINLNPNYRLVDLNYTWTCDNTVDKRCISQHTQGFVDYPASTLGCGTNYTFKLTVTYLLTKQIRSTETRVIFQSGHHKLSIQCVQNCLPGVNVAFASLLSVVSEPFFQGSLTWDLLNSDGSSAEPEVSSLHETKFGEFIYFQSDYFSVEENLTLTVTKSNAKAAFVLRVRGLLQAPNCTLKRKNENFPITYTFGCTPFSVRGVYHVFEREGPYTNEVMKSSSGRFPETFFCLSTVVVYFVDLLGDPSSEFYWIKDIAGNDRKIAEEWVNAQMATTLATGDYQALLRFLSLVSYYFLDEPGWSSEKKNSSSQIMNDLLLKYDKVAVNEQDERVLTSMNFAQALLRYKEDREVLASKNKYFTSKGLKESVATSRRKASHDQWATTWFQDFRIIEDVVGPHISGLARRDAVFDRPMNLFDPFLHQTLWRLNEKSSLNFFESLNDLSVLNSKIQCPFQEAIEDEEYEEPRLYFLWRIVATPDSILKAFESYTVDPKHPDKSPACVAITNHTALTTGNSLATSRVSFQVYRMQMDVLWWHRYETVHTEVILTRLFRVDNEKDAPPSDEPFEIKLNVLPKYYHLLSGSILNGTTSIPVVSEAVGEDPESHIPRYSFMPANGINNIHFDFEECTSKFGCRLIILGYIPAMNDFFEESAKFGAFVTNINEEKKTKYYLGVLPGRQEKPGKQVNFSIRFRTAVCRAWMDVTRMTNNCQFDRFENTTMIANTTRLSFFAMGIRSIVFTPVTYLTIDLRIVLSNFYFVSVVAAIATFLFIAILPWAVLMDVQDRIKESPMEIVKITPHQGFPYVIGVFTGMTLCSTTANVALRLSGDTVGAPGLIKRPGWVTLKIGTDDWFILRQRDSLGMLQEIQLWHDNSGCSPSWYCDKIIAIDLRENNLYEFSVRKLITTHKSDIDEAQKVTQNSRYFHSYESTVRQSGRLFRYTLRSQMMNKHILLSVFYKHPRNPYKRIDCLLLLWAHCFAMLSGALTCWLFESRDQDQTDANRASLVKVFLSGIVAANVNTLLLTALFRKSHATRELSYNFSNRTGRTKRSSLASRQRHIPIATKSSSKSFVAGHGHATENESYTPRWSIPLATKLSRCPSSVFLRRRVSNYLSFMFPPTHLVRLRTEETRSRKEADYLNRTVRVLTVSVIIVYFIYLNVVGLKVPRAVGNKWLPVSVVGIIVDLIFFQTLFCLVNACVLVFIFKKTDLEIIPLRFNVPISQFKKLQVEEYVKFIEEGTKAQYKPSAYTTILKRHKKQLKIKRIILISITILITAAFVLIVVRSKGYLTNLRYHLLSAIKTTYSETDPGVGRIFDVISLEKFIRDVFIPSGTEKKRWYNGIDVNATNLIESVLFEKRIYNETKSWMPDRISILLGRIRLSQHRFNNHTGKIAKGFSATFKRTHGSLEVLLAKYDDEDYCEGWSDVSDCFPLRRRWRFKPVTTWAEMFVWEGLRKYTSSSYKQEIHWGQRVSLMTFVNLMTDNWIDVRTHAVVVEFNVYNRFLDGVTSGGILLEITSSGVVASWISLEVAVIHALPEIVRALNEAGADTFVNLGATIRNATSFFSSFSLLPLAMAICFMLTKLSKTFKKPTLGFWIGCQLTFKFFLISSYLRLMYFFIERLIIMESTSEQKHDDPRYSNHAILAVLDRSLNNFPLMVSLCSVAFFRAKTLRAQRRWNQKERRLIHRVETASQVVEEDFFRNMDALKQRLTRIQSKFGQVKTTL